MLKFNRREFTRVLAGSGGIGLFSVATEAESETEIGAEQGPGSITDVQGVRVGHYTDSRRPTGCTAILFDNEVSAGVDYDGSAPGEQLGVTLQPASLLEGIHGKWGPARLRREHPLPGSAPLTFAVPTRTKRPCGLSKPWQARGRCEPAPRLQSSRGAYPVGHVPRQRRTRGSALHLSPSTTQA